MKPKNKENYRIGVIPDSDDLYIVPNHFVRFAEITPGLSGDTDTVSFQSKYDGKYMKNENGVLVLRSLEEGLSYSLAATFKIYPNKFFDVRTYRKTILLSIKKFKIGVNFPSI